MAAGEGDANSVPALLWDEMPEDAPNHPDYMATQALMYDESTPAEQAENFKARLLNCWCFDLMPGPMNRDRGIKD